MQRSTSGAFQLRLAPGAEMSADVCTGMESDPRPYVRVKLGSYRDRVTTTVFLTELDDLDRLIEALSEARSQLAELSGCDCARCGGNTGEAAA